MTPTLRRSLFSMGLVITLGSHAAAVRAQAPAVEPAATDALKRMGAHLRSLKAFAVEATTTDEDVLDDGQKLQRESTATLLAKVPDRLRLHVSNDRHERLYLFDGKTFTLSAERANMYATLPAPRSIGQLATKLENDFGIDLPLADLFRWGSPQWEGTKFEAAMDAGPSVVGGTTCEQFAFRQEGMDWQVWIQKGDYPLPRKLVITTTNDPARPQHTAVYTWNLAPSFNEAAFVFEPPPGAERVSLANEAGAAPPSDEASDQEK
jgi:hypothetical protein